MFDNDDDFLSYNEFLTIDRGGLSDADVSSVADILSDEYNSYDYNRDGFLSREELHDNMQCWITSIPVTKALLDLFTTAGDIDGNGQIGFTEWNFLKMFYLVDNAPKDGYLSKEEWHYYVTTMGIEWDFNLLDDGDEKISLEEWMVYAAEAFGETY